MNIGDLLAERDDKTVKVICPHQTLREAARSMISHNVGSLVVTDEDEKAVGIITERDLMRAILEQHDSGFVEKPVSIIMTRSLTMCTPDESIDEVLSLMRLNKIRHMPVLHGDKISGIVSLRYLTGAYDLPRALDLSRVGADTDALTGLSNRRCFVETLEKEIKRCQRYGRKLSLAMIDADNFKKINDRYGHDCGDRVLQALAKLFIDEFRHCDWIGRLGGEEFAVIFPETNIQGAKIACVRLLKHIRSAKIQVDGAEIYCTVSIGLTELGFYEFTRDAILKRADRLMYEAKTGGENRIETDHLSTISKAVCSLMSAFGYKRT